MSLDIKNTLQQLLEESRNFNQNDLLVKVSMDSSKVVEFSGKLSYDKGEFPAAILKEAKKQFSESGINSLCLTNGLITLPNGESTISTPILLIPCEYAVVKRTNHITIELLDEDVFVNPYLLGVIQREFNLTIPDDLLSTPELDAWIDFLHASGFTVFKTSVQFIGNFHHHRYQVVKELEELLTQNKYSKALSSMLGEAISNPFELQKLFTGHLFSADPDHEKVFEMMEKQDVVVQGPPGTGKSQVLSNILAKALQSNYSVLVLSEKKAALDVLKKRLAEYNLDTLCFVSTSESMSKTLLHELESEWNHLSEAEIQPTNNLLLSEQYEANLQLILDLLNQPKLIGGISYHEFQKLAAHISLSEYHYTSEIPSIATHLLHKSAIKSIYDQNIAGEIKLLKTNVLRSNDLKDFDQKITSWLNHLNEIKQVLPFNTWSEFSSCMRMAAICQVFENDLYKKYNKVFKPNSREQKKFKKLFKQQQKNKTLLADLSSNDIHWKKEVTSIDLLHLKNQLSNGGFFEKRKAKKAWKNYSNSPVEYADEIIQRKLDIIETNTSLSNISIEFCDLGLIENHEIDQVNQLLPVYSEEKWEALMLISESTRHSITELHIDINSLWRELRATFNLEDADQLEMIIKKVQNGLVNVLSNQHILNDLEENEFKLLGVGNTLIEYEGILFHSHWVQLQQRFPMLAQFEIGQIGKKIDVIRDLKIEESAFIAQSIQNKRIEQFQDATRLLNTPAQKLTDEEKERKKQLRKGKSILVKEFAKTRNHPSIRELYNSEAKEWIILLKPIWLSNPVQLAKCFPLQQELFDICVFDEASQIPLQNALGGIQRAKRVVVAGDEHQMGPTAYFKSQTSEVVDLLHQASFYWSNTGLMHHYRSSHPDLIAFSNKHFYQGQLKAFPSFHRSNCPIHHHYIDNAYFVDRKNRKEAEHVAALISQKLNSKISIGVVAFSEEQLNEIWSQLCVTSQERLQVEIDGNTCFLKSLENVQGDECDELIISFGYGFNESGEFNMRFGPMNTENGRRRLNVLLTRAKNEIHFFSSVKSSDFKTTDNESVELLIRWFRFIESYEASNKIQFPLNVNTSVDGNKLILNGAYQAIPVAKELVNYQIVLQEKGWNVIYQ